MHARISFHAGFLCARASLLIAFAISTGMMVNTPTPCFCFHRLTLWPEYGHGLRLGFWSVSFTAGFPFARTRFCVLTLMRSTIGSLENSIQLELNGEAERHQSAQA